MRRISSFYQSGFCSYCYHWLGKSTKDVSFQQTPNGGQDFKRFSAKATADLLAQSSLLSNINLSRFTEGIRATIRYFGSERKFADFVEVKPFRISDLSRRTYLPQLGVLLKISFYTGTPLVSLLLDGEIKVNSFKGISEAKKTIRPKKKYTWVNLKKLKRQLEKCLLQNPPLSKDEVCEVVNRSDETIKRHCRDLWDKLKSRYVAYCKQCREERSLAIKYGLEEVLRCTIEPPLSMRQIALNSTFQHSDLSRMFPTLCKAISKRYMEYVERKVSQDCEEISKTVQNLHNNGIYPSESKVGHILGVTFFNKKRYSAWKAAVTELGLRNR